MPDDADLAQNASEVYETAMMRERIRKASAIPEFRHTCEDGGRVIPARRRKANPSAMRCIECQKLLEEASK